MLVQRLRRWAIIKPTLIQRLVIDGMTVVKERGSGTQQPRNGISETGEIRAGQRSHQNEQSPTSDLNNRTHWLEDLSIRIRS